MIKLDTIANTGKTLNTLFTIPAPIFSQLMNSAICDSSELDGTIGFTSELKEWTVSFFGDMENDFKLKIEDFGILTGEDWKEAQPDEAQLKTMQSKIRQRFIQLDEDDIIESETDDTFGEDFDGDLYDFNGVNRSDFY